jgi:hypothetical protein
MSDWISIHLEVTSHQDASWTFYILYAQALTDKYFTQIWSSLISVSHTIPDITILQVPAHSYFLSMYLHMSSARSPQLNRNLNCNSSDHIKECVIIYKSHEWWEIEKLTEPTINVITALTKKHKAYYTNWGFDSVQYWKLSM